jgi:hypothetical protein
VTKTTDASSSYNAQTILEDFLVLARHKGKDLDLQAKAKSENCRKSVGVTFTVWVPQNYNVDVNTGDGNVDIGKLNGSFSAKTANGKISFECEPNGMDIEVEDHTKAPGTDESDNTERPDVSGEPASDQTPEKKRTDVSGSGRI